MNFVIVSLIGVGLISSIPSTVTYVQADQEKVETVQAEVSAYTSNVDETDDTPFVTSNGTSTKDGVIACPQRLAYGTEVEIEGKRYVCQDRMNQRYRDKEVYDVWVHDKNTAYEWGRKIIEIKIHHGN